MHKYPLSPIKFLILVLTFAAACVFAQLPAPLGWPDKLSGINGIADQKLATIMAKTLPPVKLTILKLKGRTVRVQCLEIQDQSVLVKIQDLPTPYALTLAGEIVPIGSAPLQLPPR